MDKMRNSFLKLSMLAAFVLMLGACNQKSSRTDTSNLQYVDMYIGGVGHLLHPTRPTMHLPNQMIRMYPMSKDYLDDQIAFFPLTIASHRNGELFGILPGTGNPAAGTWHSRQTYDHDLEVVRPYYFSTYFVDDEISAEFVPGVKTGFYRFTYPKEAEKRVKLNINYTGEWSTEGENVITGIEVFEGMKAYVYGVFSQKGSLSFDEETIINKRRKTSRQQPNAWVTFPKGGGDQVQFKYAISFISLDQAKKNLEKEIQGWDFESLKNNGRKIWEETLDQINVKGGTPAQKKAFYTALYKTYERMFNITEDGRYYSAYDHKVHKDDRDFYVDDWVWDTYLAQHPLRMILTPELEADMLQSYVRMYEQSGWMPQFPLLFKDNPAMHGFHSTIVFLVTNPVSIYLTCTTTQVSHGRHRSVSGFCSMSGFRIIFSVFRVMRMAGP